MVSKNDHIETIFNSLPVVKDAFLPIKLGVKKTEKTARDIENCWISKERDMALVFRSSGRNRKKRVCATPEFDDNANVQCVVVSDERKRGLSLKIPFMSLFGMFSPNLATEKLSRRNEAPVKKAKSLEKDDDSCTNCFKFAMTWSLLVSGFVHAFPSPIKIWLDNLMQNHQLVIAPRLELNGVGVISEIVPALCCVAEYIHLVSMASAAVLKMLLVSRRLRVIDTDGYGFYATDVAIQILQLIAGEFLFCSNCVLLGQTFGRCSTVHSYPLGYTPRQEEFLPSHPICKLLSSSTKDTKLRKFGLLGWNHVSTLLGLNLKLSPDIGDLQLDVSSCHLFDVVCRSLDEAEYTSMANVVSALHIVNNLVFLVLFQQSFHLVSLQRQSQDYDFIRQTIVVHSDWFGSILEFLYGSLPRPPDVLYVFSPQPTILMVVQVQDAAHNIF